MTKKVGKVIVPSNANVMSHEIATAKALSVLGHIVEFIRASNRDRETSADVYVDGEKWEMKAPTSNKLAAVERNLKRAVKQSNSIIFDSHRMKRVPDNAIQRELITKSRANKSVIRLLFVNRHGKVIDIK